MNESKSGLAAFAKAALLSSIFIFASSAWAKCPSPDPVILGNTTIEVSTDATLTFPGTDVMWNIAIPPSYEFEYDGETVTLNVPLTGQFRGTVIGRNSCEEEVSQNFTLTVIPQLTHPNITINYGARFTSTASVQLALSAVGAEEMYLTDTPNCTSGGTWQKFSTQSPWSLKKESLNASVFVIYRNAAKTTNCLHDDIVFDATPPEVNFVSVPEVLSYSSSANFVFLATDQISGVKTLECRLDSEAWITCDSARTISNLNYGPHSMQIRATDNADLVSQTLTYNWSYINALPTVTITSAPPHLSKENSAEFEFLGQDDSAQIKEYQCQLNNETFQSCLSPKRYDQLVSGNYTFSVRATDPEGQLSAVSSYSWRIELPIEPPPPPAEPPVALITRSPDAITSEATPNFEFMATATNAEISYFKCKLDAQAWTDCRSPLQYPAQNYGPHKFFVFAVDSNNLPSPTLSYAWQIIKPHTPINDSFTVDSSGKKLDIAIVIDNSASMWEEQRKVAVRFRDFISRLAGIDWRIGIITTDARAGKQNWQDGRLVPFKGISTETYFIDSRTTDADSIFKNTIRRHETGSSTEEGIRALYKMVNRSENRSFFRDNAHFASIVVTDEDERSDGAKLRPENRPETLINKIKEKFGSQNTYSNHSIVLMPNEKICPQAGAFHTGDTYLSLTRLTAGVSGNLCSRDFAEILKNIGDKLKDNTFTTSLKCEPKGAVAVKFTPIPPTPIAHEVIGNKFILSPYPPIGTQVEVTYYCD